MCTCSSTCAHVERSALVGGLLTIPVGAGHVDLLADLLHRLLEERESVLRDAHLLFRRRLALGRHLIVAAEYFLEGHRTADSLYMQCTPGCTADVGKPKDTTRICA